MKIILASASARRKKFLSKLGLKYNAIPSQIDESKIISQTKKLNPCQIVKKLALAKALQVKRLVKEKNFILISADTIGVLGGEIFGKPKSRQKAEEMLQKLSGRKHLILTGLVLFNQTGKKIITCVKTQVYFKKLTDKKIQDYLETNVYLDRAASYGIQDEKCDFVKSYSGSYTNILGLPMKELKISLGKFGIKV